MTISSFKDKLLDLGKNSKKKDFIIRNGPAVLVLKLKTLKEKLYHGKVNYYLMPKKRSLDINVMNDLKKLSINF